MTIREVLTNAGDGDLKTPAEVARLLRTTPANLCRWRKAGRGPTAMKIAGKVFYPRASLDDWLATQSVFGTPAAAA